MNAYLAIAARGKTDWWRYVATLVSAVALFGVLEVVAGVVVFVLGGGNELKSGLTNPSHTAIFFGGTGAIFGLLVFCLWLTARLFHGKRFGDLTGPWNWRKLGLGAGIWLIVVSATALAEYVIHPSGFGVSFSSATITLAEWSIPSLAIQTFAEEFVFRGYITQGIYLATRRPLIAALLSALPFAALHAANNWPNSLPDVCSAFAFGVMTSLIAIRTGGIVFTFGMHVVNNLFGALVVVSSGDVFHGSSALFTQSTPSLTWLDVGVPFLGVAVAFWLVMRGPDGLRARLASSRS